MLYLPGLQIARTRSAAQAGSMFAVCSEAEDVAVGRRLELDFIREGLRVNQRERQVFLGFAITATGGLLGFMIRADEPSVPQSLFVVCFAGGIVVATGMLTIRSTVGIKSAAAYVRLFLEPRLPGMAYERRLERFLEMSPRITGASVGLGLAHAGLATAVAFGWFVIGDKHPLAETVIAMLLPLVALLLAVALVFQFPARYWERPRSLWERVEREEARATSEVTRRATETKG